MRTLLANATVITMNPTRDVLDADILIENGVIADMGPGLAGRPENAGAERVDLSGRIVIPGLIQSHMHVTQSLFRGLADEMELMDWLQRRIWPLEGAHTPETNAAAARLAAAEGLRSGVTAFIDMGTAHCQDAIFETMRDVGMRGLFGKCMLDLGGTDVPAALMEDTETCLRESERLMNRWHMSAGAGSVTPSRRASCPRARKRSSRAPGTWRGPTACACTPTPPRTRASAPMWKASSTCATSATCTPSATPGRT